MSDLTNQRARNEITNQQVRQADIMAQGLEETLIALARYGEPRLSLQANGWYCAIDMRVASVGVEFKVKSEFGHKSPSAAAAECYARVMKTLRELGA